MPLSAQLAEEVRLEALRRHTLLCEPPSKTFADFAEIAALICATPVALVSVVEESELLFRSAFGTEVQRSPREFSFCAEAIRSTSLFEVEDARLDARFRTSPLVVNPPHIVFYAGAPLLDENGHALGTLCVIDVQPRKLSDSQRRALVVLSEQIMERVHLAENATRLATALKTIRAMEGLLPMCSYCKAIRTEDGDWEKLETYLHTHSGTQVSHGICHPCAEALLPGFLARIPSRPVRIVGQERS